MAALSLGAGFRRQERALLLRGGRVITAEGRRDADVRIEGGTIAEVLAYRIAERRWVQLDDLRTPRHGLGVAALADRVYVIGGGPEPGLTVSSANESLAVGG